MTSKKKKTKSPPRCQAKSRHPTTNQRPQRPYIKSPRLPRQTVGDKEKNLFPLRTNQEVRRGAFSRVRVKVERERGAGRVASDYLVSQNNTVARHHKMRRRLPNVTKPKNFKQLTLARTSYFPILERTWGVGVDATPPPDHRAANWDRESG